MTSQEFFLITLTLGGFVLVYVFVRWGLDLLYILTKRRVPKEVRQNVRGRR
jgi:hypothetical protein